MSSPKRYTEAIHIGTAEFSFCLGATTRAETRPPAGFRDVGNVDVYQLQIENETFQREGAYRGKKAVDASFSIKQSLGYLVRCDELTKDNLLMVAMGEDLSDNTRNDLTDTAADVMAFTAPIPSLSKLWYDILATGEQQTKLTSVVVCGGTPVAATITAATSLFTSAAHGLVLGQRVILKTVTTTTGAELLRPYHVVYLGVDGNTFKLALTFNGEPLTLTTDGSATWIPQLIEGTGCEVDIEVGRVRFLIDQSDNVYCYLTGGAINSTSADYAKSITPLEQSSFEGYGRLAIFHAKDERLTWEHRDFSCSITPANNGESTGKSPSMFDFIVKVTHDRGRIFAGQRTIND